MLALSLFACRTEPTDPGPAPDPDRPLLVCPGDAGCPDADGPLRAGAAVRSVVPRCWESWTDLDGNATYDPRVETWDDCGCDRACPGDPGYPGPDDGEGDGRFQAIWIAGFQSSRPMSGVRDGSLGFRGEGDGLWASALVLDQGGTRVGIVAVDAFGIMYDQTRAMAAAADAAGLQLDHLVVHSSHTHAAPDTLGIYGPDLITTGFDPDYVAEVQDAVVDALSEAVDGLTPVTMTVGSVDTSSYHEDGVGNLISDTRDPKIVDPRLGAARFVDGEGATVATLVHFANHPEETAGDYALLTSHFAHTLRRTVVEGVDWGDGRRPGVGGVPLYLNGTVGGMMTSLHAAVEDPNGMSWPDRTFEKADTLGQLLGGMALDALEGGREVADPRLSLRRDELYLPVVNTGFQAMFLTGVLGHRQVWNYDDAEPPSASNVPEVQTEVSLVEVGPLRLLGVPGEWLPELVVGGYDGAFTPPDAPIVDPDNVNPPDLDAGPAGPYVADLLGGDPGWVLGLANDEIGYVIPPPFFEVGLVPYLIEADGDHYEETNSLGPDTATLLQDAVTELLTWPDDGDDR